MNAPESSPVETTVLQTCPLCEAACGLELTVRDGQPVRVRGDRDDPASRGFLCPKGASLIGLHQDPDRLRTPMIRRNGVLQPVSCEEAFAETDRLVRAFLERQGREALGAFTGNPVAHNLSLLLYVSRLLRAIGTRNHFSSASVDVLPKQYAVALMYGNSYSLPVPDVDRTDFFLVLGANPLVSNGSMLTAPNMPKRLEDLRARGGTLVVVDPRRTKTAQAADEHVFIRPGTDVWFLAALARTLYAHERVDLRDLADHVAGVAELEAALEPFTPELAEERSGVPAATTVRLAHALADARSGVVYGRVGTCLQEHGTLASWLIEVLNVLTGNLDAPGGAIFTSPVTERVRDRSWLPSQETHHDRFASRVAGLPETFGELPAAALADDILEPGPGQIRGLVVVAGNPALSVPDSERMQRALEDLELLICVDNYLNETTRHADVIFPGESPLQRPHYPFIVRWAVDRYARWTPPSIEPEDRPREWEVVLSLAAILEGRYGPDFDAAATDQANFERRVAREVGDANSVVAGRDPREIIAATEGEPGPERMMDFLLRVGRDGDGYGNNDGGLSLARLREAAHGVNLGPAGGSLPGVLVTASGKVELAPARLLGDLAMLGKEPPPERDARYAFALIGRRNLRSNNSWMHNVSSLVRGRPQCTLLIHPTDAERLGITDGDLVAVSSATGAVQAPAEVTDTMLPGVVSLPHGWGHDQDGSRLSVASGVAGANSNLLGDVRRRERVTGTSVSSGIPVAVTRAAAPAAAGSDG